MKQRYTRPETVFFLVLPYGISAGFVSVTLPFLLIKHGFSVATAASITALGVSANIWRFIWAPLTDLTLNLHKWYVIGTIACAATLLLLGFIPFDLHATGLLIVLVVLSQVAATFVVAPVGGFMAKTVPDDKKGRAGGCFQAGNLGGVGIGGGAGLWIAQQYSYPLATLCLSVLVLVSLSALFFVPKVPADKRQTVSAGFQAIWIDIKTLFRSPIAVYTTLIILVPIGSGGAANIWSSVAGDWKASAGTVALVTGVFSGLISALGCVFGGWVADKLGRWWAYLGAGTLIALVTLLMSIFPFTPFTYATGVLFYAFMMGFAYAAFSAIVLLAIGKGLASTKYALLSSVSNIPVVYMTALDGWLHDKYNVKTMLWGETALGLVFVLIFLLLLPGFRGKAALQQLPS
ncbi:MAG TPA: MFS transporter [Sediminibacterium sp.]|nr:MFS transporter [Sediminibacterium sp.]